MWKQVTSGEGVGSLVSLKDYEDELAEGQRGKLILDLRLPLPPNAIYSLESKLQEAGVADVSVEASGNTLSIQFRKGFPWLAVIAGIVLASILLVTAAAASVL